MNLYDGYQTLVTLSRAPNIKLYEKGVTPPGFRSGTIDTTSMRNSAWRTVSPQSLKSLTPVSATVSLDSEAIDEIKSQININQLVTVTFPDGSKLEFWGFVSDFTPNRFLEGEEPTFELTIQPTLVNEAEEEVPPKFTPSEYVLTSAGDTFFFGTYWIAGPTFYTIDPPPDGSISGTTFEAYREGVYDPPLNRMRATGRGIEEVYIGDAYGGELNWPLGTTFEMHPEGPMPRVPSGRGISMMYKGDRVEIRWYMDFENDPIGTYIPGTRTIPGFVEVFEGDATRSTGD